MGLSFLELWNIYFVCSFSKFIQRNKFKKYLSIYGQANVTECAMYCEIITLLMLIFFFRKSLAFGLQECVDVYKREAFQVEHWKWK